MSISVRESSRYFGLRAVAGHTATKFLDDDLLIMPLVGVSDDLFPCIGRKAKIIHIDSLIKNGLALGGDGATQAVHSQLPAFHLEDDRLQESSRVGSMDAIILYTVETTKPLLSITTSGVLATRQRIPGQHIERICIKREVPIKRRHG